MTDVLFPGCTVRSRAPFIESSFRYILNAIGKDMEYLKGDTCCMEPSGLRSMSFDSWVEVNARLHSVADGRRIVTLCEGCDMSLTESAEILEKRGANISNVSGALQFIHENIDMIAKNVTRPVNMRLAMFPGCHAEFVCRKNGTHAFRMMDDVLRTIGAVPLMPSENLCCGGGVSAADPELGERIIGEAVSSFKDLGADAVVTSCPFCFMRFDMAAKQRTYHIAEIVAMAMGYDDTAVYHISKQSQ